MKAIVTGSCGTVGRVLCQNIADSGGTAIGWDRGRVTPGDREAAGEFITESKPAAIFHLALPSQPTGIENEGWLVNEKWTADLASIAAEQSIPFVYCSTVMVFSNRAKGPFTPEMEPDETEGYGYSKLQGERAARDANSASRIVRIGWQIGTERGSNNMIDFLECQAEEQGEIKASTQWLPATSCLEDTALGLMQVAQADPGTYHLNSNDRWNFYEIVVALNQVHGQRWRVVATEDFVYDQRLQDPRIEISRLEQRLPLAT